MSTPSVSSSQLFVPSIMVINGSGFNIEDCFMTSLDACASMKEALDSVKDACHEHLLSMGLKAEKLHQAFGLVDSSSLDKLTDSLKLTLPKAINICVVIKEVSIQADGSTVSISHQTLHTSMKQAAGITKFFTAGI